MSRGFDPVEFTWAGETFSIPAHRVLGAIARVEDVVTLHELQRYGGKETTPLAKLSMAYGALLRYAGAKVTDIEIYEAMFGAGKNADPKIVVESIINLIAMMIPPAASTAVDKKKEAPGNVLAAAIKKSQKKPTKLQSQSGK